MLNNSISYSIFTREVLQPSDDFCASPLEPLCTGGPRAERSVCKHTLLVHGQVFIHQDAQVLLCRAALYPPVCIDSGDFLDPGAVLWLVNLMRSTSTAVPGQTLEGYCSLLVSAWTLSC